MANLFFDENSYEPGSESNNFAVTSVPAAAGNYILVVLNHNNAGGDKTFSAPTWNGETIPELFSPYIAFTDPPSGNNDQFNKTSFFGGFVTTSTTATVAAALDGFADGHISVSVWSAIDTGAPTSALSSQQVWTPWSNPSRSVAGVAAGDEVLSFLAASLWDNGYGTHPATTWTPDGGQTSFLNSSISSNRVGRLIGSTKTGTGTVTVGYTPSAAEPVFAHFAFALKAAAAGATIDSLTTGGSPGLKVDQAFVYTTTGLGTVTGITIETVGVTDAIVSATSLSAGAGTMPSWVDTEKYPFVGTVRVSITDGTLTAVGNFTLALPSGFLQTIFEEPIETTHPDYLGTKLLAVSQPLDEDDRALYPSANGLLFGTNGSIEIDDPDTVAIKIQEADSTVNFHNITITESSSSGGGSSVNSIIYTPMYTAVINA